MEILIYCRTDHWMDALTQQQVDDMIAENPKFQRKYESRYQGGDFVVAKDDGFYRRFESPDETGAGWNRAKFALVIINNLTLAEAAHWADELDDDDGRLLRRSSYYLDVPVSAGDILEYQNRSQFLRDVGEKVIPT